MRGADSMRDGRQWRGPAADAGRRTGCCSACSAGRTVGLLRCRTRSTRSRSTTGSPATPMPAAPRRPAWTGRPPTSPASRRGPSGPRRNSAKRLPAPWRKDRAPVARPAGAAQRHRAGGAPAQPGGATAGDARCLPRRRGRAALAAAPRHSLGGGARPAPEVVPAGRAGREDRASRGGRPPCRRCRRRRPPRRRPNCSARHRCRAEPLSRRPPRRPHGGADSCRDRLYTGGPRRPPARRGPTARTQVDDRGIPPHPPPAALRLRRGEHGQGARPRAAAEDIIDLGMGNPDSPTPPHIVAKLVEAVQDPRTHRYSVSKGIPGLRERAGRLLPAPLRGGAGPGDRGRSRRSAPRRAWPTWRRRSPRPGDTILVPNPSYPIHQFGFIIAGAAVRSLPCHAGRRDAAGAGSRGAAFGAEADRADRQLPLEPHGLSRVDLEFYREIVAFARRHEIWIMSDLAYAEIYFGDKPPPSMLQVPGAKDIAVEFTGCRRPTRCRAGAWASPPAIRG